MLSKKQKVQIKKNFLLVFMFVVFAFLLKVNITAYIAYQSTKDVLNFQETKKEGIENRKNVLIEKQANLQSVLGQEKQTVEQFGIKKPGERVLIIIPE